MGDLYFQIFWDQNRLFSKVDLAQEGQGGAREPKNGPKKRSKRGRKGSKMAILALFRPLFDVFQPT